MKQQVGALRGNLGGDYNRNSKHTRRCGPKVAGEG